MNRIVKSAAAAFAGTFLLGLCAPYAAADSDPIVKIHSGKYYDWYTDQKTWDAMRSDISPDFSVFDDAVDRIDKDWATAPPANHLYCFIDASGKNGAYATGDISQIDTARGKSPSPGIGIDSNLFDSTGYGVPGGTAIVFGVHEAVNDLTGDISSGWPRDWWADDRSPFPGMTEVHILNELGYGAIATADDRDLSRDPLYVMFKNIQNRYGWGLFTRMFSAMRQNRVDWTQIDHGKNPSPVLTNMVTAYLVLGSGDIVSNLDPYFTSGPIKGYDIDRTQANLYTLGYGGDMPIDGTYTLTSVQSGLALQALGEKSGDAVALNPPAAGEPQRWTFTSVGEDTYTIRNAHTGLALDGGANAEGTAVQLWDFNGTVDQQWIVTSTPNGYILTSKQTGLVIDGGPNNPGTKPQLFGLNKSSDQKWIIH